MKMGMGMPIPDLSNLPGSSRPGGGGGTPPGPPSLPKIDNLYSFEFDGVGTYISAGNIDALNNQSSFSTSTWFKLLLMVVVLQVTGFIFNCLQLVLL